MNKPFVSERTKHDLSILLDDILSSFKNAADDYRPLIMWFWNDRIDEKEITYQLERYKEQNITSFFVHPMYGLKPDYLSDEFFELIRYTVSEAKRLDMKYWIYDEYNWPSGCAGGYVLRDEPWTRTTVLRAVCHSTMHGETVKVKSKGSFIGAQIVYFNDNVKVVKDIGSEVKCSNDFEKQFVWKNNESKSGSVYFFFTAIQNGLVDSGKWAPFSWGQEGYLDTCSKEAVREFIDYTHERYKVEIGEEFGKTVIGVFTDEPGLISIYDLGEGTLPWSKDFSETFKKMAGYDIIPHLNSLCSDIKEDNDIKIRYDYWRVISELFAENYMKQTSKWCEDNDLILTGHLCNEESLKGSVMQSGNFFSAISSFHIPGIDSIFSKSSIDTSSFNMAGKSVSSAAYFLKRERVLCETYVGSGWDLNFSEMKKIANRLLVLGINMFVLMAGHYSLKGFRKTSTCYPPSHSWHNTIFPFYNLFSDYISRMSYISSASVAVSNILVLMPTISAWENFDAFIDLWKGDNPKGSLIKTNKVLHTTINVLLELNYEFEIGFEEVLQNAIAKKGNLEIEGSIYDTLILPDITYIKENTRILIEKYISQGGRLVILNRDPLKAVDSMNNCEFQTELKKENIQCIDVNKFKDSLKNILLTIDVRKSIIILSGEGLLINHRRIGNIHFFIIINDKGNIADVFGTIQMEEIYAVLDPNTGDPVDIDWTRTNDTVEFAFKLAEHDSIILVAGRSREVSHVSNDVSFVKNQEIINLDGKWYFETVSPNILKLDYVFLEKEAVASGLRFGSSYTAKAQFVVEHLPAGKISIITENIEPVQIFLNKKEIRKYEKVRRWDNENLEYDVTNMIQIGNNEIVLLSRAPNWDGPHILPLTVISGDFALDDNKKITAVQKEILPSPWTWQGYPYYTGTAVYKTDFFIKELPGSIWLELSTRDVVKVLVNSKDIGIKIWDPYKFDISHACTKGINRLELEFTNTLNNLFTDPVSAGLSGVPKIIKYNGRIK